MYGTVAVAAPIGPLSAGEQLGVNHYTLGFGSAGSGTDALAGSGMALHGAFAYPPGKSLRFFDGANSQRAGTYDIAVKNGAGQPPERVTDVVASKAPPTTGSFDGSALWLGHSRFRAGGAPPVGSDSPPVSGTLAGGTAGTAETGTDVRADDSRLLAIPVRTNQVTTTSLLVSTQVYTPSHAGTSTYGIRPQPYLAREGGGSQWGLSDPGGLGTHQVDLSGVLDQWALLQVRADITTDGGTLPDPSDDSGRATFRYFLNGDQVGAAVTVDFRPSAMRDPRNTGAVLFGPGFGLTRGWQGDAPEVFLDNIAVDSIVPSGGAFRITSPAPGATIGGPTVFRVAGATGSVEYLLNGRPLYADGELIPPLPGPVHDLGWHTANWYNGTVTVEAVTRDASGRITGRTAPVPFKIANETPGVGLTDVSLVSPNPATTLHGNQVPWTVHTDHNLGQGQNHIWNFYVDGTPIPRTFAPVNDFTYTLDTTKLRNGKHELFFALTLEDARFAPFPALGATQVTVEVDNGHTLMGLRSQYKDVFLVPQETQRLQASEVYTDGVSNDVTASFSSSDPAIASVSPSGLVTANKPGFAEVTATRDGLSSVTRVAVREHHDAPQFTKSGQIVTAYQPDSTFMRTMFNLGQAEYTSPRNPALGGLAQQAGINTMTTGFYANPADGAARDFTLWAQGMQRFRKDITDVASQNNMSLYLTGDDIARTKTEAADSVCSAAACPQPTSQAKIRDALSWAASTGRTIGIDMVDEVTAAWGSTPTPTDGRWQSPPPSVADDAFTQLMATMNSTPRPRITWTALGIASADAVRNWTGNPSFSDYNGIYHSILTARGTYPSGQSTHEYIDGIDAGTIGRGDAFQPDKPSILLVSTTGPFYTKRGPGSHYTAGQDTLQGPGMRPASVAAGVAYAAIRGMSGVRAYGFDSTEWKDVRANANVGARDLQTGAGPTGVGAARWQAMSNVFNVVAGLEPYLLQPQANVIDLGDSVRTGAKRGPNGNALIAVNISEVPQQINASLTQYRTARPITRTRLVGDSKVLSETIPDTAADSLTLQPGEVIFWTFPH
ncbi:Ig-like domain-containing protein [Amycolatopsis samaneae]|uniref:Ig-like domain-containing protein n=1 Tax=Amycolatopsis samaneae TaxID=664691 RepID=A0ABW5GY90_9PSEU